MKFRNFIHRSPWAFVVIPLVFILVAGVIIGGIGYGVLSPFLPALKMMTADIEDEGPRDLMRERATLAPSATADPNATPKPEGEREKISIESFTYPEDTDRYGTIVVEGTDVNCDLYYGSSNSVLNKGAGTMTNIAGIGIPGDDMPIFICAHCNTFFNDLQNAEVGKHVYITTNYGDYTYVMKDMKPVDYEDPSVYDLESPGERLYLYTCYPFDALGFTRQRYLITCELVSGPVIVSEFMMGEEATE